jgi:ABC-type xylose transport system permease subunit
VRATNLRTAAILCAIVASAFVACTAPFYFYDPAGFSPLHTLGKINGDGRLPAASIAVPVLAGLSSAWLVWRRRRSNYSLAAAARDAFAIMALLTVCATIVFLITTNEARLVPMHFGMFFLFYGLIGFWPPWLYSRDP